ncbi:MAG: NAD(P)/FAD-dependent oxidoreductase [Anaerolineae bacterium]
MRYVIIGNGAAGNAAAEAIRWHDTQGQITIVSDEPHPAYYRPLLPFLIEEAPEAENLFRDELHRPPDVEVLLGCRAQAIEVEEKRVLLDDGRQLPYDRLLIATGARPFRPRIPGLEGPGVFTVRFIDDAKAIAAAASEAKRAVIIGGGRIGSKCALALRHRGLQVTVVELLDRIVPLQFDETAAAIFQDAMEAQGVELILGHTERQVLREDGQVKGVELDDGRRLEADFILVTTGVRANTELARGAGLDVDGGVLVDSQLRTSGPDIYAAGDVVQTVDVVTGEPVVSGIWTNAVAMGHVAGENMAGGHREYPGAFGLLNAMELAGVPVISVGVISPPNEGYEVYATRRDGTYRKLVFHGDRLVGAIFVGDIEGAGVYTALIREQADVGPFKEDLTRRGFGYAHFLRVQSPLTDVYMA